MKQNLLKQLQGMAAILKEDIFDGKKGRLSLILIVKLAVKNLMYGKTRTAVTVAAIAVGAGAIVFLVSFGYGLQDIVTNRLVMPNSLRLTDVQSDSTALSLNGDRVRDIRRMPGVKDLAVSISLAGSLGINNSRMDVVVIGADNRFLDYSHLAPLTGTFFSDKAQAPYQAQCNQQDCRSELEQLIALVEKGQVAGEQDRKPVLTTGEVIGEGVKLRYRVNEDRYIPVRAGASLKSPVIGYTRSELFESLEGVEVWGGVYESADTAGKAIQDKNGDWWGRWIKTSPLLWSRIVEDVYEPQKEDDGSQKKIEGYIGENNVKILSSEEVRSERHINELIQKANQEKVLGLSTASAQPMTVGDNSQATEASRLKEMLTASKSVQVASSSVQLGVVEVKKQEGLELVVSTGFLKTLKLDPNKVIGKQVTLEYIISGGLIQGVAGRIVSKPVAHTIVGVVKDDRKPYVFAPISEIESMGVNKYTLGKLLATTESELPKVRERVEKLGFVTSSIVDTLAQVNRLFAVMRFLLGTFGMIAFVVAVFGMFNTLTVSLLERTREIAVMKTLGTTDTDVVRLFMMESLIMGMLGGLVGIETGKGLGQAVALLFQLFQTDKSVILFKTPFLFMLLVFLFSTVVGMLTGIFPSQRAKRISALDALRYE